MKPLLFCFIFVFSSSALMATPPFAINHKALEARPSTSWQYNSDIVDFYRSQNRHSNESYFNSNNPIYQDFLKAPQASKDAYIVESIQVGDLSIELHEKGKGAGILIYSLGKSSHFIRKEDMDLDSGNAGVEIQDIRVTEDEKYIETLIQTQGAITFFEYRLIDLQEKKIIFSLSRIHSFPQWAEDGNSFDYTLWKGPDQYAMTHKMGESVDEDTNNGIEPISFDLIPTDINELIFIDIDTDSGRLEKISAHNLTHPNGIVVHTLIENMISAPEKKANKILVPANQKGVIEGVVSDEKNQLFAVKYKWGARSWVSVFNFSGDFLQKLEFPPGMFPASILFEPGLLNVKIQSITGTSLVVKKDLKSGEWLDDKNLPTVIESEFSRLRQIYHKGLWHLVDIEEVLTPTHDSSRIGTIPTLLIRKAQGVQKEPAPLLIKLYGGFGLDNFRSNNLWPNEIQFILDGGTIAQTGLRGGSEKGNPWHAEGAHEKKINSALDLISVAKDLVDRKYTLAHKIAIHGTSNGGLVAGTALVLSPESFGLVITVNGVLNPLSAQWLDAPYYGWAFEYGSFFNGKIRTEMLKYDPYHNISKKEYPAVLAVVGLQDDRVAAAHTFKFIAKLQENQTGEAPILMTAIKNAGHHPSLSHHPAIRRVFEARVWTMIYQTIVDDPKETDLQFDPE